MKIVLASASPRRQELLRLITENFTVCPADVDETLRPGAPLESEVRRLSEDKARRAQQDNPDSVCVGSDTLVTIDGLALGKPENVQQARQMLCMLRGREHLVLTGLCVRPPQGEARSLVSITRVHFRNFSDEALERYLATGEMLDKAGAYGIQGHGALLIEGIEGDYYSVMGLPVAALSALLEDMGCRF